MDESRVRKMFKGMSKDGWFDGVTGFVFGRPLFYNGDDYQKVVSDVLKDYDVPIVFNADVGHKPPRMTIINGAKCTVETSGGSAVISYDLTERCRIT